MPRDRAAYMRAYRAGHRPGLQVGGVKLPKPIHHNPDACTDIADLQAENAALTEEVARLKRDLASRPLIDASAALATEAPRPGYRAPSWSDVASPMVRPLHYGDDRIPRPAPPPAFAEFRPAPKPGKGK
jgi:hypothetical protein